MTASSHAGHCLIEARGVVKSFGQTPALRGADVQVAAGLVIALIVICVTLPLLKRMTGPDNARFE